MPLPSSPDATAANRQRSRRTPATDSNPPAGALSSSATALVADTAIVAGVPSGSRTITHGTPPTARRPSTAKRLPASG